MLILVIEWEKDESGECKISNPKKTKQTDVLNQNVVSYSKSVKKYKHHL